MWVELALAWRVRVRAGVRGACVHERVHAHGVCAPSRTSSEGTERALDWRTLRVRHRDLSVLIMYCRDGIRIMRERAAQQTYCISTCICCALPGE